MACLICSYKGKKKQLKVSLFLAITIFMLFRLCSLILNAPRNSNDVTSVKTDKAEAETTGLISLYKITQRCPIL